MSDPKIPADSSPAYQHGPTISSPRIRLRPVTAADLPFLQTLWNDGEVMRYVGFPEGLNYTQEKLDNWWTAVQDSVATHLLVETQDGTPLGESGWGFLGLPGMLEMKLARAHWGHGYASETLETLLTYLFSHTTIETAVVTPHPENTAARKLYQRFGFRPAQPPANFDCGECEYWTVQREQYPHPLPAPSKPNTLVFDWGGVLMRTADDGGRRKWERKLGLPAGGADRAVFGSPSWLDAQVGKCSPKECWAGIGRALGLDAAQLVQFRHDFWVGDRLNLELVEQIRHWKAAGYRIALLSNYSPELEMLLDENQVRELFDPIIISAYEGVMKPAAKLYWRALNRIGIHPAAAIFVDDFAENITGVQHVGWHGVHFQNTHQTIQQIRSILA